MLNGTIEFQDGLRSEQGLVTVFVNESFHPICDLGWDDSDAQVLCDLYEYRYHGHYGKKVFIEILFGLFYLFIVCFAVGEASHGLPPPPNSIYVAYNNCSGVEHSFGHCN